jgi:hypothetical protein
MSSWLVSDRSADSALEFMPDLQGRLANRAQLTNDGHGPYLSAVEESFGGDIDYAMLVRVYGHTTKQEQLQAILNGRQPTEITLAMLMRPFAVEWTEERKSVRKMIVSNP